jgi:hypothetical protein
MVASRHAVASQGSPDHPIEGEGDTLPIVRILT